MHVLDRLKPLSRPAKELAKEAIWSLAAHEPGPKKDICLYATRRGGSSWLMEILAADRGIRFIDQPFALRSASSNHMAVLPIMERSQFAGLAPDEEAQVEDMLRALFSGELTVNAPWRFWRPGFDWKTDRTLLKIVSGKGLIDWIDQRFSVETVYFTRHPIPTALSAMRNEWDLTVQGYLNNRRFADAYLNERQQAGARRLLREGTLLQQHVLNWGVENLLPFRLFPDRLHWLLVSYEEVSLHPKQVLPHIAERLDLDNVDRMRKQLHRPSRSTRAIASGYTDQATPMEQVQRWRQHVSEQDIRDVQAVLDLLEIDLYQAGQMLPTQPARISAE